MGNEGYFRATSSNWLSAGVAATALALGRVLPGGEEQCAGCAFAEPGCEQGAAAYFRGDNLFEFLRVEEEEFGAGWLVFHHGHAQHDAVIGCHADPSKP